ncbi:MAG: hypothetical protein ABIR16_08530, partial [Dokdonella sp.]
MMAMSLLVGILIAIATLIAAFGVLRSRQRWAWLLAVGQLLAGALLYVFLFPPQGHQSGGALTILTPGVTSAQLGTVGSGTNVIALPGILIDVDARIERAPDLATALRRHPDTSSLQVVGNGLPLRDRAAARGLAINLDESPLGDGVVELALPPRVQLGNRWRANGRIHASTPVSRTIELRDPSDAVAATVKSSARGEFQIEGVAHSSGLLRYQLSMRDDQGSLIDELPLTLDSRIGTPLRVLLLAAVPTPEL